MINCTVNTINLTATSADTLTAGRVGLRCGFAFSTDWDGLAKTVYFLGNTTKAVILSGDEATIPPEVLAKPGYMLRVGVVGKDPDGTVKIPTVWGNVGMVHGSAGEYDQEQPEPTPDVIAQIQLEAQEAVETAERAESKIDTLLNDGQSVIDAVTAEGDQQVSRVAEAAVEPIQQIQSAASAAGSQASAAQKSAEAARAQADAAKASADEAAQAARESILRFGGPRTAHTSEDMTDTSLVYVYTGGESDYINGNWYYYDGNAWASGGVYNAIAFETDPTLTVPRAAADAKETGAAVRTLESVVLKESQLVGWTSGGVVASSGRLTSSDKTKRNTKPIGMSDGVVLVRATEDYTFAVYAYAQDESYVGSLHKDGFVAETGSIEINSFALSEYSSDYRYIFTIRRADGEAMSIDESVNIQVFTSVMNEQSSYGTAEITDTRPLGSWETGSFAPASGNNINASNRLRTTKYIGVELGQMGFVCDDSVSASVWRWNALGTFEGSLHEGGFIASAGASTVTSYRFESGYYYKLVLFPANVEGSISLEDCSKLQFIVPAWTTGKYKDVKIAFLGDSIIAGRLGDVAAGVGTRPAYTIPQRVEQELGVFVYNYAVGGMGWIGDTSGANRGNAYGHVQTLDLSGYTHVVLSFGANDGAFPIGTVDDTAATTSTATSGGGTILGNIYGVLDYIHDNWPHLQVILIAPFMNKHGSFPTWGWGVKTSGGWAWPEYYEALSVFAQKYHLQLINGDRALNSWLVEDYIGSGSDEIHPVEQGYDLISRYVAGQIGALL